MAAIERYRALQTAVDRFFDTVRDTHGAEMECRSGCSSCCHQQVSIAQVEADALAQALAKLAPEKREALIRTVRAALPSGFGERGPDVCGALGPNGACQLYKDRPIACRSWGLMNFYRRGGLDGSRTHTMLPLYTRPPCGMNFTERDASAGADLGAPRSFDVDHWNEELRVIDNERATEIGAATSPELEREITLNWRLAELLRCRPGEREGDKELESDATSTSMG